jgi:hypothetical protein
MNNEDFKALVKRGIERTIAQGGPCVHSDGVCSYGFNGKRCAVGHMMTDEEHEKFKDVDGSVTTIHAKGWKPELSDYQLDFLLNVQSAHDGNYALKGADFIEGFTSDLKVGDVINEDGEVR